jgi:hypothetical protein
MLGCTCEQDQSATVLPELTVQRRKTEKDASRLSFGREENIK